MLSLQRTPNHLSPMMPWFAQPLSDSHQKMEASTEPAFWHQMSNGSLNLLAASNSTSSSASSCTASTTVPTPLVSGSSSIKSHKSFYPSHNDVTLMKKQTRSTLRTINNTEQLNLPLGNYQMVFFNEVVEKQWQVTCEMYSQLSRNNTARGSCTNLATVGLTKV